MTCRVCGQPHCPCAAVASLVTSEPLILIVDGCYVPPLGKHLTRRLSGRAGAGLVLATARDERVLAVCAARFVAYTSVEVESQAILRGLRWAPQVTFAYSDCEGAIDETGRGEFLPVALRDPLHNLAHRLANIGAHRNWPALDRLWIPGADAFGQPVRSPATLQDAR